AWSEHPPQESRDRASFCIVGNLGGNHDPGEGSDRIGALAGSVHNRSLEIFADLGRVLHCSSDALQAGLDEFPILISNPAVTEMILERIDEFHIANRTAEFFD